MKSIVDNQVPERLADKAPKPDERLLRKLFFVIDALKATGQAFLLNWIFGTLLGGSIAVFALILNRDHSSSWLGIIGLALLASAYVTFLPALGLSPLAGFFLGKGVALKKHLAWLYLFSAAMVSAAFLMPVFGVISCAFFGAAAFVVCWHFKHHKKTIHGRFPATVVYAWVLIYPLLIITKILTETGWPLNDAWQWFFSTIVDHWHGWILLIVLGSILTAGVAHKTNGSSCAPPECG